MLAADYENLTRALDRALSEPEGAEPALMLAGLLTLRRILGEEAFAVAWTSGQAMIQAETVTYARQP